MKTKVEPKGQGVQILSMSENQCVWMKAGVVNFKICENAFDCTSCAFDKAISRKSIQKPTALVSWREVMRSQPNQGMPAHADGPGHFQIMLPRLPM